MGLLLDTQVFLWWVCDSPELSRRARAAIASRANQCHLSLASCWEMAIKVSLNKLRVPTPVDRFVSEQVAINGFGLLPIDLSQVSRVVRLAFHHRDPFDRLLAAQALEQELAIVSADKVFTRYGVPRIW